MSEKKETHCCEIPPPVPFQRNMRQLKEFVASLTDPFATLHARFRIIEHGA